MGSGACPLEICWNLRRSNIDLQLLLFCGFGLGEFVEVSHANI